MKVINETDKQNIVILLIINRLLTRMEVCKIKVARVVKRALSMGLLTKWGVYKKR